MNTFSTQDSKLSFKLDFGEGAGGRRISRTISIGGLSPEADSSDAADMAVDLAKVFEPAVKLVTLARTETMEPQID